MDIIILLSAGIIVGMIAGLLGLGGGVIVVPALVWVFQTNPQIPSTHLMHIAIGTSLATIVITSISSMIAHHKHQAILWPVVKQLTPGILLGAFFGAVIADKMSYVYLRTIFSVFLFIIAIKLLFNLDPKGRQNLPQWPGMTLAGIIIGKVSALVGIGGGSMTVPFLVWGQISMRNAVATSAACGLPIAISGAIGFIVMGWDTPNLPTWSLGHVYLPALLAITATSLFFAPLGAKLAHTLPVNLLKKIFAVFLIIAALKL